MWYHTGVWQFSWGLNSKAASPCRVGQPAAAPCAFWGMHRMQTNQHQWKGHLLPCILCLVCQQVIPWEHLCLVLWLSPRYLKYAHPNNTHGSEPSELSQGLSTHRGTLLPQGLGLQHFSFDNLISSTWESSVVPAVYIIHNHKYRVRQKTL